MDTGGTIAAAGGATAGVGVATVATGIGAAPGAVAVVGGGATAAVGGVVSGVGAIVEGAATGLDAAANYVTSGQLNAMALATASFNRAVMSKVDKGIKAIDKIRNIIPGKKSSAKPEASKPAKPEVAGDGVKVVGKKKGPCDHLRKGNGKGEYRGGSHNETSKPKNDGKDSHHMPADDVSPLKKNDGPAIQMEPKDHRRTSSNGNQGLKGVQYRAKIDALLAEGKWREAVLEEIKDVRKIASKSGNPRKYNEAMLEMQKYFKCLEKHGLLK